jgi:small subunit ribosomal protein S8e
LVWNGGLTKRKKTGGKRKVYRNKKRNEAGRYPTETLLGETKYKVELGRSKIESKKLMSTNEVNVSDPSTGKTEKLKIIAVVRNPANVDYNRRGVITKGAIIRTEKGMAKVVSSPGQDGVLNAIVHTEET